ncbi:DUF2637 domain-containing protein [Micromonospora coxensis]|uniref:DUF2637 domain-containing protein n=1 Tax=Micromonospora coxensis TaxID=356852 RepID=A0A1C5GWK5_9ACTN|nr:DUF2637 domain-containing protein [Micromonospora coxensis]SCG38154.1 Protein of unknown function [Micromonospora coxensis]
MKPAANTPDPSPTAVGDIAAQGKHLRRLRWAVRATLALGVAASVAANVLHAHPNPISQIIAAWPPLALMLTVELISRVPHHRRLLGAIRITAAATIAIIAAWVSYWHLVGVASRYGENDNGAAYLLPISVDGLVIVASVSLVEITARIRAAPTTSVAPTAPAAFRPTAASPARRRPSAAVPVPGPSAVRGKHSALTSGKGTGSGAGMTPKAQNLGPPPADTDSDEQAGRQDDTQAQNVPTTTAAAVAYWRQRDPALHPAEVAARIGKSERTVRRHWPPRTTTRRTSGHPRHQPAQ